MYRQSRGGFVYFDDH